MLCWRFLALYKIWSHLPFFWSPEKVNDGYWSTNSIIGSDISLIFRWADKGDNLIAVSTATNLFVGHRTYGIDDENPVTFLSCFVISLSAMAISGCGSRPISSFLLMSSPADQPTSNVSQRTTVTTHSAITQTRTLLQNTNFHKK